MTFGLACGLGIPVIGGDNEAEPTIDLDGGLGSEESDSTTTAEEPTPEPGQAEEEEQATEPEADDDKQTTDKPALSGELAQHQILILPGGDPPTMDPHLSGDATSAEYVVEIYSGLMAYDRELNLIPDIAESYQISEDGLVYTFKIREEAQFQDGKPIRAADFKWSFERACDPATGSPTAATYLGDIIGCRAKLQGQADEIEGVVVVDDFTLQLTIDEPKGFFLAKMTYPTAYVLDRENVERGGNTWATESPNGSGPFKLTEFFPGDGLIILENNENYYRDPRPTLEKVVFLVGVPINPITGYEEGLGLPGDFLEFLGLPASADNARYDAIPVGTSLFDRVTDPNSPLSDQLVSTEVLSVFYIGFNVDKPPFDDVKVRQAFNLALDKRRMVTVVFKESVPVANGIVPPSMPDYQNPDLSDYEFDPEQALALIAESSYEDVTELPDVTLHVSGAGGQITQLTEAIVASYQENLGITISVETVEWARFLQELNQPDPAYQLYQLGWIADYPDPQNFLEVLFHSESAQNHGGYSNPELDTLLAEARRTQDREERLALYRQAEQIILDDAAWIPLYFEVESWLIQPYVQGFEIPPLKIPRYQYVTILEH